MYTPVTMQAKRSKDPMKERHFFFFGETCTEDDDDDDDDDEDEDGLETYYTFDL